MKKIIMLRYKMQRKVFFNCYIFLFICFSGIADFAKESASKNLGAPKVHLSFTLDGSGIVTLSKAEVCLWWLKCLFDVIIFYLDGVIDLY